jgi:hypothetical protein
MTFSSKKYLEEGFIDLGPILDKKSCKDVLLEINNTRDISTNIFVDELTYKNNPKKKKTNPRPGKNLTEKLDLKFIEEHPIFKKTMNEVLGENYNILLKKLIVGIPDTDIPDWVKKNIKDLGVPNLGQYIKEEFQDITYFHGIDFHQDLIDHPNRKADFITLYVYLDDVSEGMSPLSVSPKSHIFGATTFPHDIKIQKDKIIYSDKRGNTDSFENKFLLGETGQVYFWSSLTIHGTQPTTITKKRISLRYLIEKGNTNKLSLIDEFNKNVNGPLSLTEMRFDIDTKTGEKKQRGNILNKV